MKISWLAVVSIVASGGLVGIAQALGAVLPHQATLIMNLAAIAAAIAAFILQASQPAAKILADAPVVTHAGDPAGVNVSTTSTLPIAAPSQQGK